MALRILLADDSMTAQNMGKKILTDAGYEVVAVSNGAAAVKKIAEISPHLCILDIYMPGYTGLEVCEKIKGSAVTARMPVLLTVGKMEPYKPEDGARVRADGVIVKPFEASELLRAVHRFSQRMSGAPAPAPATTTAARPAALPQIPPPPPPSTPATYERTVKLTREQIQEYMEPGLQGWRTTTHGPDTVAAPAAHTATPTVEMVNSPAIPVEDIMAGTKTASTSDGMPTFAVAAIAEAEAPATLAVADLPPSPSIADEAALQPPPLAETPALTAESPAHLFSADLIAEAPAQTRSDAIEPSAAAVLPGFVDYLIAHPFTDSVSSVEPSVVSADGAVLSTGAEILASEARSPMQLGYEIPSIDPALEVAPEVSINPTPDPQFETPQEIRVENATEEGLQPTSRAAESDSVSTSADPNLAPMEGLIDAVNPLEGGRFVAPGAFPVEAATGEQTVTAPIEMTQAAAAAAAPMTESTVADAVPAPTGKKTKKGKEMRPIPAAEPAPEAVSATPENETVPAETPAESAPVTSNVTEEIAAVLNLLGQTTASLVQTAGAVMASAPVEEQPAAVAARIWMAEEVPLSDAEASTSLENEMRIAYAPKVVELETLTQPVAPAIAAVEVQHPAVAAAVATAEDTVRDDKNAPRPAVTPDLGASPPGTGASPTQELAAAMAAAFGGALPKEDLARAEETQSISEEVRRFALGDSYKPKPATGFGGAAIADVDDKRAAKDNLTIAIGRALDRLKPQLVAEILKELEAMDKQN